MRTRIHVAREIRMAHQVFDAHAEIRLALQPEHLRGGAVEPEDFAVAGQQHHALGHRRREATELAEQLRDAAPMKLLAAVDAPDQGHHVAPDTAELRWILFTPMLQPAMQPVQVGKLQAEVAGQHDHDPQVNAAEDEAAGHRDGDRPDQAYQRK